MIEALTLYYIVTVIVIVNVIVVPCKCNKKTGYSIRNKIFAASILITSHSSRSSTELLSIVLGAINELHSERYSFELCLDTRDLAYLRQRLIVVHLLSMNFPPVRRGCNSTCWLRNGNTVHTSYPQILLFWFLFNKLLSERHPFESVTRFISSCTTLRPSDHRLKSLIHVLCPSIVGSSYVRLLLAH